MLDGVLYNHVNGIVPLSKVIRNPACLYIQHPQHNNNLLDINMLKYISIIFNLIIEILFIPSFGKGNSFSDLVIASENTLESFAVPSHPV